MQGFSRKNIKTLYVNSNDRDTKHWPNPNMFEIELPERLRYTTSISIETPALYVNISTFTNSRQNISLWVEVLKYSTTPILVTIAEGSYSASSFASQLGVALNNAVASTLQTAYTPQYYDAFTVYVTPANKLEICNAETEFALLNATQVPYKLQCDVKSVWVQSGGWGLPYYAGFARTNIQSVKKTKPNTGQNQPPLQTNTIEAPYPILLENNKQIHMTIDHYNQIMENMPYPENTNASVKNDYNGRVHASFALMNVVNPLSDIGRLDKGIYYEYEIPNAPVQINKLKFSFRDHQGNLVDLENQPIFFTLNFCVQ